MIKYFYELLPVCKKVMKIQNIYIGEQDELIFDVIKHLVFDFYTESGEPKSSLNILSLSEAKILESTPKVVILGEEYIENDKLDEFLKINFNIETDFFILISSKPPNWGKEYEKLSCTRIWHLSTPLDAHHFISIFDVIFLSEDFENSREYHNVPLELLSKEESIAPCDIYIQLNKNKYVKILNAEDLIDKEFILEHSKEGLKSYYILFTDIKVFYEKKISELMSVSKCLTDSSYINKLTKRIGISQDTITTVNEISTNILIELKRNKKLSNVISNLDNQESFLKNLSQLTAFIAIQIAKRSGQGQIYCKKLVFASILCDLLVIDDQTILINDGLAPEFLYLSKSEVNILFEHGTKCGEIVSNAINFSNDEVVIIEQHHERPNGNGFPHRFTHERISNNASLFITAQEFAYLVLKDSNQNSIDVSTHLETMKENGFEKGHFSKYFSILSDFAR